MKRSKLWFIIIIISIVFINIDVNAASCSEAERSSILNHFNIKSSYNSYTNEVTISVDNGSFIVNYIDDNGFGIITDDTKPNRQSGSYEGVNFDYYSFGSDSVVSKNNPIKFKVKSGGTINIGMAFFKTSGKESKDSETGCYSYDYWLKNSSNASISTFETKTVNNNNPEYIQIVVPNKPVNEMKTNSNKDTFCRALTNGENYNNKFNSTIIGYWSNDPNALNFYRNMLGDCWNDKVIYVYSEKQIIPLIENILKLWHNNSISRDTGMGKDELWSINFDNVKNKAKDEGHAYYYDDGKFYNLVNGNAKGSLLDSNAFGLFCDYKSNLYYHKTDSNGNVIYKDGKAVYNIDANISNYYAISTSEQTVKYTYNYTGSSSFDNTFETESVNVCTVSCEEAVEVKYGPPVASKAGLCFEYQVQVTSRVKCDASINPDAKPKNGEFCSPVPYCNWVPGYVHQGGPVDEYDQCINKCDGGKYSKNCSNKCYKKVYGSISGASKMAIDIIASDMLKRLSNSDSYFNINNGLYIRDKNNNIYWRKDKAGNNAVGYARYYLEGSERNRTISDHGGYTFDVNGFKRAKYGDSLCTDSCYYTGCDLHTYLNPGVMEADYAKNIEIYNNAIANCKLSASCTEKTAKFKISVDYKQKKDSEVVKKTINFADSSLVSDDDATCSNPTVPSAGNILLNYQGCYKNCGIGQQYHARWSFPGTWFNMKTGEMSYTKKPNDSWFAEDEKFCTPRFAQNVNEKWWNYYLHNNKTALANFNEDDIEKYSKQCSSGNGTIKNPLSVDDVKPSNSDYNIHASTENFGYFGWNFNIKCFYALNDCGNVEFDNYRIRSVDNQNLFPDTNGSSLSDTSSTGRSNDKIGFNWTSSSVTNKNPDYVVDPPKLISIVQSQAASGKDAIYTDENLDYLFNLSPNDIKDLRNVKNYNSFSEGKYMKPGKNSGDATNGISRYYSDVITKYAVGSYRPSKTAVLCNNIRNLSTGECDKYDR